MRLLTVVFLLILGDVAAQVRLPKLISDSMVLQRDAKIRIWGWAGKNEKIDIRFQGKRFTTRANAAGDWQLWLPAMKVGGPYTMQVNTISIKDILIGDVWLCSGQSNMVHQMELHSVTYANDIANANNAQIRHFWIKTMQDVKAPHNDLPEGSWKPANPQNVRQFSAVAYFFAQKIYDKYKVPIGLINASVGGTPIEAWTSEEGLKEFPAIQNTIRRNKDTVFSAPSFQPNNVVNDKGIINRWYESSYNPRGWRTIAIPGYWEDQGVKDLNGVVWYRKEIDIPASMAGQPAKVFLGRIVDADVLYINGRQIGQTTYMYPQRRYIVPVDVLKPGKNLFVIKVSNNFGKGGFVPDKPYYLFAGTDTVDLKGYWQYKVGEVYEPRPMPAGINLQNEPTALYNAMIAPLTNYTIKGFLWYQGESNTRRAAEYASLQPAQISDWRKQWRQGALPFLYVQLPGFMDMTYLPTESEWALFRESQLKSLAVPNTGMAVAIDAGEWNDIHPDNKKVVGERLALAALAVAYKEPGIEYSGPLFKSATVKGDQIVVEFTHTGRGLIAIDQEPLTQFAIAGADKRFVWADARIEGSTVVVSSTRVPDPLYVRYAWADNPADANLYNKEGLPASPFRTDQ